MEFKKLTISLPRNMYVEGMGLVNRGLFSNFSDLVRTGIREEFKQLQPVAKEFDEELILNDKELIAGVKQSMKEARAGKGVVFKSSREMSKYLKKL